MSSFRPAVTSVQRAGLILKPIGLSLLCLVVISLVDSSTVSAQGLFGRMRARIEARRQPVPPVPNPAAPNPNAPNPALRSPVVPEASGPMPTSPRVLATPGFSPNAVPGSSPDSEGLLNTPAFGIDVSPARVGQYQGLRVIGFQPNSRAPSAGLQLGDVIVSIEGQATRSLADVSRSMANLPVGQGAEIQVIRNGRLYRTKVPVIAEVPAIAEDPAIANASAAKPPVTPATSPTLARPRSSLGLDVRNASPQRGIEVVVAPEGTAGVIGGLQPQDRIVSVEGRLVKNIDGLIRELSVKQPGDLVQFGVVRGESMLELDIMMGGPGGKPIRGATELNAPTPASADKKDDSGNSLLGGMGAALGGLFAPEESAPNPGTTQPKGTLPPTPAPVTDKPSVLSESEDSLALPEDEATEPTDEAPNRDGSADLLPPPQGEADTSLTEVERLRAEIERLKRQLEQEKSSS